MDRFLRFEEKLKTLLEDEEGTHVERAEAVQGVKRKCDPRWTNSKPEKAIVKKVNIEIEGIHLPDLSSTLDSFETSLVTFHNQLKLQRHVEEFTEQQLRQNLECSP